MNSVFIKLDDSLQAVGLVDERCKIERNVGKTRLLPYDQFPQTLILVPEAVAKSSVVRMRVHGLTSGLVLLGRGFLSDIRIPMNDVRV